jgi:hypothetical protein
MVETRRPSRVLVKVAAALGLVAGVGFLVMRSAQSSRSEPYSIPRAALAGWRLSVEAASRPNDAVLVLRAPSALTSALFDQTFKRSMESMASPEIPGLALVLEGELARAGAPRLVSAELVELARAAGLEAAPPTARCFAHRRMPEPNARRQLFFALFDSPAFTKFRGALAARLGASFEPDLVSPVMFLGTVESTSYEWMPPHAEAPKDCLAPIVVGDR